MCARVHGVVVARDAVAAGALALSIVTPRAVRAALQHVQLIWRQNCTQTLANSGLPSSDPIHKNQCVALLRSVLSRQLLNVGLHRCLHGTPVWA